jgi:glutathione S-transferase
MDLYRWEPDAASLKLMIALKEKGIAFQDHYVDLLDLEHHGEAFKAAGGGGRVPLLVADGEALTDSQLALEYLAEAFEPRLAPSDPAGWYDVQAWTAQLDQALAENVRQLGWHTVTLPAMDEARRKHFLDRSAEIPRPQVMAGWAQVTSDAEASEDQLANARERIEQGVARIEAALQAGDWLVGGAYSVVDINAFALTHTLPRLTPELVSAAKTPRMMAWLARIAARPAVKAALAAGRSPGQDDYAPLI